MKKMIDLASYMEIDKANLDSVILSLITKTQNGLALNEIVIEDVEEEAISERLSHLIGCGLLYYDNVEEKYILMDNDDKCSTKTFYKGRITGHITEKADMRRILADKDAEIRDLYTTVSDLKERYQDVNKIRTEQRQTISDLKSQVDSLSKNNQTLEIRNKELETKLTQYVISSNNERDYHVISIFTLLSFLFILILTYFTVIDRVFHSRV